MPQMVTHYQFGLDVASALEDIAGMTPETRAAYLLGNQGPDPFFYLLVSPGKADLMELGELFHAQRPGSFFCAAAQYVHGLDGRRAAIGRAYLSGLACHYLLDRNVHPLVYFWQNAIIDADVGLTEADENQIHAEIERDIDEAVLYTRLGATVARLRPADLTLAAPDSVLEIAGEIYAYVASEVYGLRVNETVYGSAVNAWRTLMRVLWSPTGRKRALLAKIEQAITHESSMILGQAHRPRKATASDFDNADRRPWQDPFTGEVRAESLEDLAKGASSQVFALVEALSSPEFDQARILGLTGGLNFSGERVGEDALELPEELAPYRLVDKP